MDPILYVFLVVSPLAFIAGVVFHKYVISEAVAIKAHVTAEVAEVRADIASLVGKISAKV
jgi:hypothetical protein